MPVVEVAQHRLLRGGGERHHQAVLADGEPLSDRHHDPGVAGLLVVELEHGSAGAGARGRHRCRGPDPADCGDRERQRQHHRHPADRQAGLHAHPGSPVRACR
ncbi:MAG: hypothetical protein H0U35_07650, partial [Sporichthyaceae bacterium]|nr:hypothetical protein [Sporichthyaceae bacterium]